MREAQDEFLKIKEKNVEKPPQKTTVRIAIPSLPQYESDDDEEEKQERLRKRQKLQSAVSTVIFKTKTSSSFFL